MPFLARGIAALTRSNFPFVEKSTSVCTCCINQYFLHIIHTTEYIHVDSFYYSFICLFQNVKKQIHEFPLISFVPFSKLDIFNILQSIPFKYAV
jgi:hypothetical protein